VLNYDVIMTFFFRTRCIVPSHYIVKYDRVSLVELITDKTFSKIQSFSVEQMMARSITSVTYHDVSSNQKDNYLKINSSNQKNCPNLYY